jgi:hypothetical protein
MTLFYFNIMFLFIMFLVCSSSISDRVMIDNEFMHEISKRLIHYSSELSGRHYVSMVLRYCLPMDALYMSGQVVDHKSDNGIFICALVDPFHSYLYILSSHMK